jgi:hypothetical protein
VDELAAEAAAAYGEQNQGIAQLNTAVAQIDQVTQSNAASAEETASAATELKAQADTLKEAVATLLRLAGGGATGSPANVLQNPSRIEPISRATAPPSRSRVSSRDTRRPNRAEQAKTVLLSSGRDHPQEGEFKDF